MKRSWLWWRAATVTFTTCSGVLFLPTEYEDNLIRVIFFGSSDILVLPTPPTRSSCTRLTSSLMRPRWGFRRYWIVQNFTIYLQKIIQKCGGYRNFILRSAWAIQWGGVTYLPSHVTSSGVWAWGINPHFLGHAVIFYWAVQHLHLIHSKKACAKLI